MVQSVASGHIFFGDSTTGDEDDFQGVKNISSEDEFPRFGNSRNSTV